MANASAGGNDAPSVYASRSIPEALLCVAAMRNGVFYCFTPPMDFLTLIGIVQAVFGYAIELGAVLRRQTLLMWTFAITCAYVGVLLAVLTSRISTTDQSTHVPLAISMCAKLATWIFLAHLIGLLHYNSRRLNLWQHRSLRLRQQRVLKNIDLETANCEELLKNVLPPHLISSLASLVQARVRPGERCSSMCCSSMTNRRSSDDASECGTAVVLPTPSSQPALIAESYTGCTFLFAKVGGPAQLINDPKADPRRVLRLLQMMYDRFDRLADTFNVQKVRKTANEYYLVAAGLPDPALLPSPHDRACAIAGFGFALLNVAPLITLELERMGFPVRDVEITLQVGLHSGGAIAGIIGHKTFQYDLCGDAVNTAARMCSTSLPGRVHVSEATEALLNHRFDTEARGEREVKGKGIMRTYFLHNAPPGVVSNALRALMPPANEVPALTSPPNEPLALPAPAPPPSSPPAPPAPAAPARVELLPDEPPHLPKKNSSGALVAGKI